MNSIELSELIYPEIANDTDYEAMYPHRDLAEGAKVTRLGPSPTGFIHLGNLYGAFVDERLASFEPPIASISSACILSPKSSAPAHSRYLLLCS